MSDKLKSFLHRAFIALAVELSKHLGDRKKYVGASDIAGCPRKAVLNRLRPEKQRTPAEQMVLALGHAVEDIIARLFTAGGFTGFKREVEYVHPEYNFIRCHVDFTYETDKEIRIRELKSTKSNPEEPYSSWVNQLLIQMGLASIIHPEKMVSGSVMAVDRAKGHCLEYIGYTPNANLTDYFIHKGRKIWAAIQGEGPVPNPEPGDGNLCGFCLHKHDCPAHDTSKLQVMPTHEAQVAARYKALSAEKKEIECRLDILKGEILSFTGDKYKGVAGDIVVNVVSFTESATVDSKKLKADFPEVYAKVTKPKAAYVKLEVK